MGFTTPCFIRKNTKELRDKLENIGYKNCIAEEGPYIFTLSGIFDCMHSECGLIDLAYNGLIDCGDNEKLFLAIAALRDDDISLNDKINEINKKYGTKIEFRR